MDIKSINVSSGTDGSTISGYVVVEAVANNDNTYAFDIKVRDGQSKWQLIKSYTGRLKNTVKGKQYNIDLTSYNISQSGVYAMGVFSIGSISNIPFDYTVIEVIDETNISNPMSAENSLAVVGCPTSSFNIWKIIALCETVAIGYYIFSSKERTDKVRDTFSSSKNQFMNKTLPNLREKTKYGINSLKARIN